MKLNHEVKVAYLRESFLKVISMLNSNKIDYWLTRGLVTLIADGYLKDNPKIHDIDFHVSVEYKDQLEKLLVKNGFKLNKVKHYKISFYDDIESNLEFVFLKEDPNKIGNLYHSAGSYRYSCPKEVYGDSTITLKGVEVRVPYPFKDYIEQEKIYQ